MDLGRRDKHPLRVRADGVWKTFTVTGITNLVVDEIMAMAEVENRELYVCCFELLGKKAYGR